METTLKITGMDCEHCAAHVKEALGEVAGVEKVKVELKKGLAKIKHKNPIEIKLLTDAVKSAGYSAEL